VIRSTRFNISAALSGLGAVGGGFVGGALTALGGLIAQAPPRPLWVYAWNAGAFAALGAVVAPFMVWTMLRDVPLWRAIAEPAVVGLVASVAAMMIAPSLFLLITGGAIGASIFSLRVRYPGARALESVESE